MAVKQPNEKDAVWRAELDGLGVWVVQKKLDQAAAGHGALVRGFVCGEIERGFIEKWLSEKERADARQQAATLRWARIAGWASVLAVIVAVASTLLTAEGRHALRAVAVSLSAWLGE
jgi:hypothetical protein